MDGKKIILSIVLISFIFFAGCILPNSDQTPNSQSGSIQKPIVVVSIPPQQQFVETIAGDSVELILLVPPGADPHTYEPTPSQLAKISSANLYLTVGSGVEVETIWLERLKSLNPKLIIVDTHNGISLIEMEAHAHEETHEYDANVGLDPHVWTSLKNAKIMVQNSKDALISLVPKNSQIYTQNANNYLDKLNTLDKSLENKFLKMEQKTFFVFHPAWGYFAKDYNLTQEAIESLGKEPTPTQLASIVQAAKEDNVKIIFASPQFSTDSAKTLAGQIGGSVVLISPLERDYLKNTQDMADAISKSLDG